MNIIINGVPRKGIITNHHVVPSKQIASGGVARFFYEGDNPGIDVELRPEIFFKTHSV